MTASRVSLVQAQPHWRSVEFISDLHLQAQPAETFELWLTYLQHCQADALFILGDLFEVWIGDDAAFDNAQRDTPISGFEGQCLEALRQASARMPVYFMRGNRDFLLGARYLSACGVVDLDDPAVLVFRGKRYALSHGDALCLDDTAYQAFRAQVRSEAWQQEFLARPLAERAALARAMREQSEARKRLDAVYADADLQATRALLTTTQATTLIHGHTHRPANHAVGDGLVRVVLSDWDALAPIPRAQALRLDDGGLHRVDLAHALRGLGS